MGQNSGFWQPDEKFYHGDTEAQSGHGDAEQAGESRDQGKIAGVTAKYSVLLRVSVSPW